jgi:alpha,alpha-trehalose phosphorylase
MIVVYGFGGLRDYDGTLCFRPHRPPQAELQFSITYREQLLDVEITPVSTRYSLRKGEHLVFRHEDEDIALTRTNPSAVRPTMEPLKTAS